MSRETFLWSSSLVIAALYMCFGVPMIFHIGLGALTPWAIGIGVILGLSPLLGLVATNSSDKTARVGIAGIFGLANLVSILFMSFGGFFLFKYSPPSGSEEIFGTAMVLVSLVALTVNTVMYFRILTAGSLTKDGRL